MARYLFTQLRLATATSSNSSWNWAHAKMVVVSWPLFAVIHRHTAEFWQSAILFWLCAFWALDWLLGSAIALRKRQWSARRGLYSCGKLVTWVVTLLVAFGLRQSLPGLPGQGLALLIEAAVLSTEGASVLRNLSLLHSPRGRPGPVARLLRSFADRMEREPDEAPAEGASPA